MKTLNKISDGLNKVISWILVIALAAMVVIYFLAVFFRFVLNSGIPWAEELSRYLHVALVLLGSGLAARNREHINVSALESKIKNPDVKRWLFVIQYLLFGGFFLFAAIVGCNFALKANNISPSMRLPMGIIYGVVAFGSLLIAFQSLVYALNLITKLEEPVEHSEVDEYIKEVEQV